MAKYIVYIGMIILGGMLVFLRAGTIRRCTEEATATVVGVERQTHRSRGHRTSEYHPIVEFAAKDMTVHKAADISSIFRGKYKEGATLNVRYNPENPEEFLVKGKFVWTGIIGGSALILLGALGLFLALK